MKRLFVALLLLVWAPMGWSCAQKKAPEEIKLMSFNIRMSLAAQQDGENCWENRAEAVLEMLQKEQPLVVGMQEVCADQLAFLDTHFAGYGRLGVGRDDGVAAGETMAVYYNKEQLTLGENGTFWLSQTPFEVSRGWDAACNRTCTWVLFTIKESGRQIAFFNTHMDHVGKTAREESIKVLLSQIELLVPKGTPTFLLGDFNASTSEPLFAPLQEVLFNARETSPVSDHLGTYNAYRSQEGIEAIDHVFYLNATPVRFDVLRDSYGVPYVSDHFPVVFTARL